MFLPQCVGTPRAPVLSKRPVNHVRYHRRAEQKYEECQHNQVPPIPGHAVLPFFPPLFRRIMRTDPTSSDARVIIYASCAPCGARLAVLAFWFDMPDVRALTQARSRRHDFLTAILPVVQRI